ncbi:MAG: hypothetical protein ACLP9K_07515 [Nitrososphaerales archaeon]
MAIIATIILVVVAGALIETQQPPSSRDLVTVQVAYAGSWSGFYLEGTTYVSWNGTGTRTATLISPTGTSVWIIVAEAQKLDGSSETLTVSILLPNGTFASSNSTSVAFGAIQTSCEFSVSD